MIVPVSVCLDRFSRTDGSDFRPDLEALRGVAVLAVVAYHAMPQHLSGGFLGVDVFFVLSGFLITRLLLRELNETGRVDLVAFWARRFRRIAPAAIFVLIAVAALAFAFPVIDGRRLGQHITAASLSYYNWRQAARGVDYLAHDDTANPLLHYWSLSVEEQFYVIWPVLLVGLAILGVRGKRLLAAALSIAALSFALAVHFSGVNPSRAFFGTDARAWQLLAGASAAMIVLPTLRPRAAGLVSGASATILMVCFATAGGGSAYSLVIPTMAATVLIWCGATWLTVAPLRYAGRISFSWYLWHWPLIVILGDTTVGLAAAVVISFIAAVGTFHAIENPIRRNQHLTQRALLACGFGIVLIGLGTAAGAGMSQWGIDAVYAGPGEWITRKAIRTDRARVFADGCLILGEADETQPRCEYGRISGPTVVLFGDSHAGHWFQPLEQAALAQGWRLIVRLKAGCGPIDDGRADACGRWRERTLQEMKRMAPELIFLSSAKSPGADQEVAVLNRLMTGGKLIAIHDTPRWPTPTADCLARARGPDVCQWPVASRMKTSLYPIARGADLPANASVIDFTERICPRGVCNALSSGAPIFFDADHLTATYSATFVADFASLLASNEPLATGSTR